MLPDGEVRIQAIGKTILYQLDGVLQSDGLRGKQQVDVVWHYDIRVEFVVAQCPVVEQGIDKEFGHSRDLEDRAAVTCGNRYERYAGSRCAGNFRHIAMLGRGTLGENPTNGV